MKTFLRFLALCTLITLSVLPAEAQTKSTEKAKPAGTSAVSTKFELEWSRPVTPMVQAARARLELLEQKFKTGTIDSAEVEQTRFGVQDLERRMPYSLTIQSRGGSLKEFVAVMAASEEVSFTLINAGEAIDLETPIPAFTLRNANWATVIEVLANFLATRDLQLKIAGSDNPNPAESKSVVCVLRRSEALAEKRILPTQFESFPLAPYLPEQSIDDIVSAIRAGWELDSAHDKDALKIKFHQPTSILLVSGPPEATHIAGKIVSQLKRTPPKVLPPQSSPPAPTATNKE